MMNNLKNKVQLIGRLGENVNTNELENGNQYARLSVATNEVYTNKDGEKVENTTWHNCVAWGKTAELIAQYAAKGKMIAIEGKLVNRNYEDKEGVKRYITEIQVSEFLLI